MQISSGFCLTYAVHTALEHVISIINCTSNRVPSQIR